MDSDSDIELIERVSGMSSLEGGKDEIPKNRLNSAEDGQPVEGPLKSPSTKTVAVKDIEEVENYDDEPDESLGERLMGLTEMFPESVRNFTGNVVALAGTTVKALYSFTCNVSWIVVSTSVILFSTVIFETERAQVAELQKAQQKQVFLGPGSAMPASGSSTSAKKLMR